MIDTSRHYYPVEVILQHIDAMAYAKFNTLHWFVAFLGFGIHPEWSGVRIGV